MRNKRPGGRSRRLSKHERELVLDLLYQEALRLVHEGVPVLEMDRQLRELRRDLVRAVRAGMQFAMSNPTDQAKLSPPELSEKQEK
ncbi:MAG: hypothetical protein WCD86_17025 [Ktedonobacteraceae bacterium]